MKRLRRYIMIFCLAISIPLAFVILRTAESLGREETAQLGFFAEALFDGMERELAELVQREENRAVDEYHHTVIVSGNAPQRSPLAEPPAHAYILGYLQNNPDGSFQTPLAADLARVPAAQRALVSELQAVNQVFNRKKYYVPRGVAPPTAASTAAPEKKKAEPTGFADRFLSRAPSKSSKDYLGQKETRLEEISPRQALNIAPEEQLGSGSARTRTAPAPSGQNQEGEWAGDDARRPAAPMAPGAAPSPHPARADTDEVLAESLLQVEVAPFQSVLIDPRHVFIFRRVAVNNQIYRQGFVLLTEPFLRHLAAAHFAEQPLARYALLDFSVIESGARQSIVQSGATVAAPAFTAERVFAAPYNFLAASLNAATIPASPARRPLYLAVAALGTVLLVGLLAIYHSARTVVDMSERRSRFVSSVTHELKTPLTNIRMYIEMLENGIAATPQREQEYLRILGSESARLGRLIDNVLELARLEKRRRRFQWQTGDLTDVLEEVCTVMAHKLGQEGFSLRIAADEVPTFTYDREVLIQILINLIENSIKFGRQAPLKEITIAAHPAEGEIHLAVSDSGPGIPRPALKKVFDDFYRAEDELTRKTGGTGLGLALVKKFISAMGGRVQAINNPSAGCTIDLFLPLTPPAPR
jgi:signal transduction histidine kinase